MLGARLRDQRGFTLMELLVTLLIISGGMAATAALVVGANATTSSTQAREAGTALAREVVETSRSVPYARLNQNTVDDELRSRNGLTDSSATDSGWQVERRGTVFTVNVVACSVDDPKDGIGQHAASAFCEDPAQTSPADSVPDDYKRVTSTVRWKPQGKPERSVRQTAIVTNPTSNAGPQITGLSRSPTADPISSDSTTSITFTATTSIKAAAVRWTVDGVLKSTDAPTATTSTYTWPISGGSTYVVDGTYVVGATGVNEQGQPGTTRSLAVRLDRGRPVAVDGLTGGWNARISKPELEWRTNPESDVVGYRLYRKPLVGSPTIACETPAGKTECIDESPPAGETIDYYVVALDKDVSSGANREGAPSGVKTVTRTLDQPRPPGELTVSSSEEGPRLTWTPAPDPPTPYPGSNTLFYRIYRDGELVSNRIDRTGDALELTFTDTDPATATGSHAYRVSTVDSRYSESPLLGPVSP